MKTNKRIRGINLFIAVACALQGMVATTLSVAQVTAIYHEISMSPVLYACGTAVLVCFFMALVYWFRHPLAACSIAAALITVLSLINYYEMQLHGTVLTIQDVKNISTAMGVIRNYSIQPSMTVGSIVFSYAILLFTLAVVSFLGIKTVHNARVSLALIAGATVMAFILSFVPFSAEPKRWSWEINYYTDSAVVGFLENIRCSFVKADKPDNYSVDMISNATGTSGTTDEAPDIIVILNETYFNMDHLTDLDTDVPYMGNYDMLDAIKGYATVPMVGGGTNASEYELLTSNSISLLNTNTPFNDLDMQESISLPRYLRELGFTTMAAHTEPSTNYHRGNAWAALGFDEVHFQPDFYELEYYGQRYSASDSSVFKNFVRFYEAMPEDAPRFGYLLTIQNHGGWDRNSPGMDTVHVGGGVQLSEPDRQVLNEYLTCIRKTDSAIKEITDYFSSIERNVIVYMVGDHGPSLLKTWDMGTGIQRRQTPYFIWSNYGLDEVENPGDIDLCSLTPLVLKVAGLPLSPYYTQLVKVAEQAECITNVVTDDGEKGFIGKNGIVQSLSDDLADPVRTYFFMEYNGFQGKDRIDRLFFPNAEG